MKALCSTETLQQPRCGLQFGHCHILTLPIYQLMTPFTWKVAKSYLVDTLGKIIQSIIDGPVMELNSVDGVDVQVHVQILGEKCLQVWQYLEMFVHIETQMFNPDNRISCSNRTPDASFHSSSCFDPSNRCSRHVSTEQIHCFNGLSLCHGHCSVHLTT